MYAILFFLPALTLAIDLKPYNETAHMMFVDSDMDKDGSLSKAEIDAVFKGYDTNGDGRVSRHEYTEYVDVHTPSLHPLSHALYDIYDVDNDHHLDNHDYDNFLNLMDGDGDGMVAEEEFVRYWSVLFVDLEHLHGQGTVDVAVDPVDATNGTDTVDPVTDAPNTHTHHPHPTHPTHHPHPTHPPHP